MKTSSTQNPENVRLAFSPQALLRSLFLFFPFVVMSCLAQAQTKVWDTSYGGTNYDALSTMVATADGGYLLAGRSLSGMNGDKSEPSKGNECDDIYPEDCASDAWLLKTDAAGNKLWDKTYGNYGYNSISKIIATPDGGYMLGGVTSKDPDDPYPDYWLVKVDGSGNQEWEKAIGGKDSETFTSMVATPDGGFLLGGYSRSGISGDKSEANRSGPCDSFTDDCPADYWLVKVDESGNIIWDKSFGGNGEDLMKFMFALPDGGYLLAGTSESGIGGDKSKPLIGVSDFWIVTIDENGDKIWDESVGNPNNNYFTAMAEAHSGGYLLGGNTKTEGAGTSMWTSKISPAGSPEWYKVYKKTTYNFLTSITQDHEGNYLLGGYYNQAQCNYPTELCTNDYWAIRVDAQGKMLWETSLGGDDDDQMQAAVVIADGSYLLGGTSYSGKSGDKTEPSRGSADYWIVKVADEDCSKPALAVSVHPSEEIYTGANANVVYLGYGPKSVVLQAKGGESYSWSPTVGLSNTTTSTTVFTPTAAGTYTFTVTGYDGSCSAVASVTVEVVDVHCGEGKVQLCHSGNPICIPAHAVAAHLRNHSSDHLGNCATSALATASAKPGKAGGFLSVYPNPFWNQATVELYLAADGYYRMELHNSSGKLVSTLAKGKGSAGQLIKQEIRSAGFKEGTYYIRVYTDGKKQTFRLLLKR